MKKAFLILLLVVLSGPRILGGNLIRRGDFSDCEGSIGPECRTNGGKASLFTEELNWNRCGRLEVDRIIRTPEGHDKASACVWIGGDGRGKTGFPAKPDTTYRFSVEIRGDSVPANISATEWRGDDVWRDCHSVPSSVGGIVVQKSWTKYQGTFKTGPDAKRAALTLAMWQSSQYGEVTLKVGSHLLFDNVYVEERGHAPFAEGIRESQESVPVVKAILAPMVKEPPALDGRLDDPAWSRAESFSDFVVFKKTAPAEAGSSVRLALCGGDLYLGMEFKESREVVGDAGWQGRGIWQGDVAEIFFGPKTGDRLFSQFAVGAGGGRYAGRGEDEIPGGGRWEARTRRTEGGWAAEVRIPLSELGWSKSPESGEVIGFEVCRQRRKAGELSSWTALRQAFGEPENFGTLVLGSYEDALAARHGLAGAKAGNRREYETQVAAVERRRLRERYEALGGWKFAVAPVSPTSQFAVPFMPDEVFQAPVETIRLAMAVNERRGLPIAVANLTGAAASYRVLLETRAKYNGDYGLAGFPQSQIAVREGLRFKDSDEDAGSLRFDPLPRMGEGYAVTVPPREAGLVWFDFDTSGVEPGEYLGRIRVIPLGEPATWTPIEGSYHNRKYTGDMRDIPFVLVVRNIVLDKMPDRDLGFFEEASNESVFQLMAETGASNFGLSPWSFQFKRDGHGNIDYGRPDKSVRKLASNIREVQEWSAKRGVHPTYFIGFSAYHAFQELYGLKNDEERSARLWPQWIRCVKRFMNEHGVPDEDYEVETWDEPDPDLFDMIDARQREAKESVPTVRFMLTLGAHILSAENMRRLSPHVDSWTLWRHGYFSRPGHLDFIHEALQKGKCIRHYTCSTSMRAHLYRNYRLHAWFAEYHRLTGSMLFIFHSLYETAGSSDFKVVPFGNIVYGSFGGFMPSIRYMALRQGFQDVKYLDLLRRVGAGNPEAGKFLDMAARKVAVDFAHDQNMADEIREQAARMILRLQKEDRK